MYVGFTGSRKITEAQRKLVIKRLEEIKPTVTHYITGACTGVDAEVALWAYEQHPEANQIIVVPNRRLHVDDRVMHFHTDNVMYIEMPRHPTSYRDRNERIVDLSERVEAFWDGRTYKSGTYMTINIAKKDKKLHNITRI
jgi:hypothetical protein